MNNENNKLFLLDAMALIYRAYFAFIKNPRITSKGEDVSAIFGFLNTLLEIQKKHNPSHIAVAFDLSGSTFRHDIYPEYKANRDETPEPIRFSIPIIKDLLKSFNIPILEMKGFEADDIIATLSKYLQTEETIPAGMNGMFEEKQNVMIISSDKDFIQLQQYDNVKQFSPIAKKFITDKDPKSYLDEHILRGDKSDGIPNILSDDNVFVEERRQIPLTKKKIAELDMDNLSESNNYRYSRNKTLIDLSCIPERIEEKILTEWKETDQCKSKKDMLNYFMKHRLKNLMEVIEEF